MRRFPKNFLWGAATSSYQVEGNNRGADWWPWEKKAGKERSGEACRHYDLYEQDFDLVQKLHHNIHRFSIEWSRVEPWEGKFLRREIQHYVDVVLALRRRGILPMVTLHHFTNPLWFSKIGGWEKRKNISYFVRFCDVIVRALAKHVQYWITVNEPTIYVSHAYLFGAWPPQGKSLLKATAVVDHMAWAHVKAYRLIHGIYDEMGLHKPAVSIAHNVTAFVPHQASLQNRLTAFLRDQVYNLGFLERIVRHNILRPEPMDFIGVNYYSRQLVELRRMGLEHLVWDVPRKKSPAVKRNSLGWDIYPQGLYEVLLGLKKYHLPIMITENGICTDDDDLRWQFIRDHLQYIHRAMKHGVNVMGYLYWSLLDNFEWDKGFGPRFGLIDVNYRTFKRTVRPSARKFGEVCRTGILMEKNSPHRDRGVCAKHREPHPSTRRSSR